MILTYFPLVCVVQSALSAAIVPLEWSTEGLARIPIQIGLDGGFEFHYVILDTRPNPDSPMLWLFRPNVTSTELVTALVTIGANVSPWREDIFVLPMGAIDEVPSSWLRLRIGPTSDFAYAVYGYIITPNQMIINQRMRDHLELCNHPHRPIMFPGLVDGGHWGFYIQNNEYVIDSTEAYIVLSEDEFERFWGDVSNALNDHNISLPTMGRVQNCDRDLRQQLDEILPTFSYMINDRPELEIFISPSDYLLQESDTCIIAVLSGGSRVLGSPLFRSHSVFFETDTVRIGICEYSNYSL